ncbi:MAG: hypothetical protein JXA90_02620, partial [Planctomycetes bacterium]|nr:hypothetical protein [Planctomycetota bacterium]
MAAIPARRSIVWTIFAKEARELLRDRRAVFVSFILPLVLYPLLFAGLSVLPRRHQEDMEARPLKAAAAGETEGFLRALREEDRVELISGAADEEALRAGEVDVIVEIAGPETASESASESAPAAGSASESESASESAPAPAPGPAAAPAAASASASASSSASASASA